ncbi:invasion associated locus B family protein [Labrys monachus]|uniref:Uncharacterized protein n=1 Tax=Labrys monachus TaxID=217067 RepID=A0ABU0FEZ3_9HYPH|nr:invasion associated locus B family protein [Labrys monachus]MDQ0392897.1 hypothetical protein [Labrys monachus]
MTLTIAIFFLATVAAIAATPKSLGVFGKWSAWTYLDEGRSHCFVYSNPVLSEPAGLDHGAVTFFVRTTLRKSTSTEASFQTGYRFAPGSEIRARVDGAAFHMFSAGNSAWLREGKGREDEFVRALERGREMTVEAVSSRGNETKYRFSLDGVTNAMRTAQAACP